jgi:hypothetical protein
MDITDLKVTIKDRDILSEIDPDKLKDYLEKNEWEVFEDYVRDDVVIGNVYRKYCEQLHRYLHVRHIFYPNWPDYPSRMAENLFEMEGMGISQLKLYCEITGNTVFIMPDSEMEDITSSLEKALNDVVS